MSGKKQRDVAAADAELAARREKEAADAIAQGDTKTKAEEEVPSAPDVLGEQEDNDVIF